MASTPLGGPTAVVTMPGTLPPMPAVARILARFDRAKLGSFVEVAIGLMDLEDGDPEIEANGDEEDQSFPEATGPRGHVITGAADPIEDAEEDDGDVAVEDDPLGFDPEEDMCGAGDDRVTSGAVVHGHHQGHDGPGDAEDAEREQMADDVPMLPVVTLAHNLFTDQRQPLGFSNLQTSFRSNAKPVRSADSGRLYRSTGWGRDPGAPV
jgi:hypothetical protein